MKNNISRFSLFAAAFSIVLVGASCATTQTNTGNTNTGNTNVVNTNSLVLTDESDFTPPTGRPNNPPPASAGERRLLLAHSTDGVHFTSTGEVLTDQGNVPDAVVEPDGTIRVYYIGQSIQAGKEENTVVAISKDNGATWIFKKLILKNWPQPRDPSDPDVVLLEDGTYRMYYTTSLSASKLGIVYADSPDGITFTHQGESLASPFGDVVDSNTMFFNGLWHMYVLQEKVQGQLHATSTDGFSFSLAEQPELRLPMGSYIFSNPLVEGGTLRMFAFSLADKNIRSFTSADMESWTVGDVALEGDDLATDGTNYIQDSTVVKLNDGSYLMIYVSELPVE